MELGYFLSSEEQKPHQLISHAHTAERSGITFIVISHHLNPWVSQQGESSFVWSVLGGIAQATERVGVGTAVTCPIMRFHPALAAQAAATVADMMPGRFFLGLGTGEYLNEHIFGYPWPGYDIRREMLIEAIHIIRELLKGDEYSFYGTYFTVHDARIYTLPDNLPPIYLAASGPETATLAGQLSDGLISTTPGDEIVNTFKDNGGSGKPCFGQIKVCWANSVEEAKRTMQKAWPVSALSGRLHVDLPTPKHFEDAVELMGEPEIPEDSIIGPDPDVYFRAIQSMQANGYDHIYLRQVGPDQQGFLEFYKKSLAPLLEQENLITDSA